MNEELKVIISAEINKLKKGVNDAKKKIQDFAKNSADKIQAFNDEFSKIGDAAKSGLKVAAGAVAGAATALLALSATTAEYRAEQAKLQTAFETAGGSADAAKQTYNDLYRVLGDSGVAVEAANHLAKMTTNQQELSEWTNICQGVYATFGDSLPIEGLTEAANETAKVGTVTGSLADALNWAGISEDDFNAKLAACNTEQEREQLIRNTLNGLYSDAAANYETNAAALLAQNEAQNKLNNAMAAAGEAVAPIQTALTDLAATFLEQLTPYIQSFVDNNLPALQEALSTVGEKVGSVLSWISDNWDTISTIGTIVLGVAAALSVMSTILTVVGTVMAFVASPFALIIALIVAIVAAIVTCIVKWDEIKAKILEVAGNIAEKVSEMKEKVVEGFNNMKENMATAISEAKEKVISKYEEIKSGLSEKAAAIALDAASKFGITKETMTSAMELAKKGVSDSLTNMKNAYNEHGGGIQGIASAAMEAVKGYYRTGFTFIDTLTGGKLSSIVEKVGTKMGEVQDKVSSILESVKKKFTDIWDGAKKIVSDAITTIKGAFDFDWSLPKIKLPHFSVSGGKAPWGFMGEGSLPKISISWYAKGGVFDKPTLFPYGKGSIGGLGEAGAEAIVPLEKNTQWLDKIAERLAAKQGAMPIVLEVDGKTFAQTSINTINQLTRQSGKLGINIV